MLNRLLRITTLLLFVCTLALLPAGRALAAEPAASAPNEAEEPAIEITPKHEASVEVALMWLSRNQANDGSWRSESGTVGTYQMAMTSLAGLAILSAGHSPGRGKYGAHVEKAIRFILKHQDRDGLFTTGNDSQQMYGHGFAVTFLAEAYGMMEGSELNGELKEALTQAVKKIAKSQSARGGWYYSPNSGADEGSVTITQVQALRSARNAGIDVPGKTLQQAIEYVQKCQNSDGGIRYSLEAGQTSSIALTAAGAELFLMAGQYAAQHTQRACDFLKKNLDPQRTRGNHDFYTNFYGSQAMFQIGGDYWKRYFESMRTRLISGQTAEGCWRGDVGTVYSTSIAVMIMSLPYGYLPIFQR